MGDAWIKSLLFGAVLAGSIGPIALLIFGTAARRGFAAGVFAAAGAALADLAYALVAFSIGALVLPLLAAHQTAVRIASASLLVALGLLMLLRPPADAAAPAQPAARMLLPVFLLTLVNPMTIVVFAGFVPQLPLAGSLPVAAWLAFALGVGSLTVAVAVAGAGALLGAALPGAGWRRAINAVSAAGILAFGIAGLAGA
ncbi:MAG TPA: LysE family transporter [Steroidobacteraceae bacterium]|nr:LysE family transporter [Steroidobacteraceae bacterium]